MIARLYARLLPIGPIRLTPHDAYWDPYPPAARAHFAAQGFHFHYPAYEVWTIPWQAVDALEGQG